MWVIPNEHLITNIIIVWYIVYMYIFIVHLIPVDYLLGYIPCCIPVVFECSRQYTFRP